MSECSNESAIEIVKISRDRYNQLIEAEDFLDCLYAAGVDNWVGYDEAWKIKRGEDDE